MSLVMHAITTRDTFVYLVHTLHVTLCRRDPASTWTRGTVTLAGDAANPMPPNLGQGGNKALEDVAVLAECLVRLNGSPSDMAPSRSAGGSRSGSANGSGGVGRGSSCSGGDGDLYPRLQDALALYERVRLPRAEALLAYSRQVRWGDWRVCFVVGCIGGSFRVLCCPWCPVMRQELCLAWVGALDLRHMILYQVQHPFTPCLNH